MQIDDKVEPWLRALLDGVENSNSHAEMVATGAYAAPALVKALEGTAELVSGTWPNLEPYKSQWAKMDAALALARGDAA